MAKKNKDKWFTAEEAHGAASKFGQLLGEAFADAVYRFIVRYLSDAHSDYVLLKPSVGKKVVRLDMMGGTKRQMDNVIVPKNSNDPVALFESKWLKDGRHHNDKGAWILQLREIRKKYSTVRGAVANLAGYWNEGARLMFQREGRVRMVVVATDYEVYSTLQPAVDAFTSQQKLEPIDLSNTAAIREKLPSPEHLANCLGLMKKSGELEKLADTWLKFEREKTLDKPSVYGEDLIKLAIDELLAPLPPNPQIELMEISLQIDTGNIIHKTCSDIEEVLEFINEYYANAQAILEKITPRPTTVTPSQLSSFAKSEEEDIEANGEDTE